MILNTIPKGLQTCSGYDPNNSICKKCYSIFVDYKGNWEKQSSEQKRLCFEKCANDVGNYIRQFQESISIFDKIMGRIVLIICIITLISLIIHEILYS